MLLLALVTEGCFLDVDCQVTPWRETLSQAFFEIATLTMFVAAPALFVAMSAWKAVRLKARHGDEAEKS